MASPKPKVTPQASPAPVVGRKPGVPAVVPMPSPSPAATKPGLSVTDKINGKLSVDPSQPKIDHTKTDGLNTNDNYSDAEILRLGKILKKLNYPVKPTRDSVVTIIATYPELAARQAQAPVNSDFISGLEKAYLPGLDTPTAAKAPDTTRQVYQYKPEEINALIDDVYVTTLGRPATEQEKQAKFAVLNDQIQQGTTSVSKVVKNKKTGKMETLVTQTPAFSQTAAKTSIEAELKKANPDDFDRKKRIDFAGWLSQNVAGA